EADLDVARGPVGFAAEGQVAAEALVGRAGEVDSAVGEDRDAAADFPVGPGRRLVEGQGVGTGDDPAAEVQGVDRDRRVEGDGAGVDDGDEVAATVSVVGVTGEEGVVVAPPEGVSPIAASADPVT